jgi:2',3'-cyclic-nucleotide 2'-phosphodiesterase (5'-nucleotidase family)
MLLETLLAAGLAAGADTTLLRVLSTNDFHGALESRVHGWSAGRPAGGAAALKATLDRAAASCRCTVLRLDGGDQMQGSLGSNLVFGRSVVEVMNALGLDAAVVGNHELDWGLDTLRARMREAKYPWLAANVFDSATGRRPDWARPFAVLGRGGMRIAVVGYMAERTRQMVSAAYGKGLVWRRGVAAIDDVLTELRTQRPDLTILVAHEGAFCDSLPCAGEIVNLARELPKGSVDLIVSGHTHSLVNTVVNGIPIVQSRSNGTAYGISDLVRRDDGTREWRIRVETVWSDRVTPDSAISAILARYRPMVERFAGKRVTVLAQALTRSGNQYPLGHLMADALRNAAPGIDFGLMNNGGIRRDLPAGPLSYSDLFELSPFGNNVTRVTMTGAQVLALMEIALQSGSPRFHISGLAVRYDPAKPARSRVISVETAGGRPLDPAGTYVLGTVDFLQTGGEGLVMLNLLPSSRTGRTDLENLTAYLERLPQPLTVPMESRFIPVSP